MSASDSTCPNRDLYIFTWGFNDVLVKINWLFLLLLALIMLTGIIVWFYFRDAAYRVLNWDMRRHKRKMADSEVQECIDWLLGQKSELETSPFGVSRQGVLDAADAQNARRVKLHERRKDLDKLALKPTLTDDEIRGMFGTYQNVQALSEKRSSCFKVVAGITLIEEQIQAMSTGIDVKAMHLVKMMENNKNKTGDGLSNESLARTTQNCISAVRQNWRWVDEVMQCAHVHLANAAAYHEFFHDVEEVEYWMQTTMSRVHLTFDRSGLKGDTTGLNAMTDEMKDTMMAYLRWQSKVDALMTRARELVPVHKRLTPITQPCPALALTDYKSEEFSFAEGDTLILLDNSDKKQWKVQNSQKKIGMVPAVIVLVPGPSAIAVDAAIRLRLQLLALWSTSTKRLGFQMIAFMQLVFRDWTAEEIKALKRMSKEDKAQLLGILQQVEEKLGKTWEGYEGFQELQEKTARLRTILEEPSDGKTSDKDQEVNDQVIIQVKMLETLFNKYQEFWTYWETYKIVVEMIKSPRHILVCDKWEDLRYKTTAHYVRFWDTNMSLASSEGGETGTQADSSLTVFETPSEKLITETTDTTDSATKEIHEDVMAAEESVTAETAQKADSTMDDYLAKLKAQENGKAEEEEEEEWHSSTDVRHTRRREETQTDEVRQSTEEVRHTFVIKSVTDPRTQEEISLQEAIRLGIVDQTAGTYVNPDTGHSVSIQAAMASGDITVQFTTRKKVKEVSSSYGIITVKTSVETRPYTIHSVLDPSTEEEMTDHEAYERGILDRHDLTYKTDTGEKIPVLDAIQCGFVKAEFHGEPQDNLKEETKTYAVSGIVDQRRKMKIPFTEAIDQGLLDRDTGMYVNNVTGEKWSVSEAIMKGFIKAKIVTDPGKLDIDPENRIVVEKLASVRQKVLKAVRVTRAFQTTTKTTKTTTSTTKE